MPSHRFVRVALEDDTPSSNPQNPTYFTGIPTTAPPSFHTIELHSSSSYISQPLPHRNDETAATLIPHNQRPSPIQVARPQTLISDSVTDDGGISIWAPSELNSSEEGDLNAMREDILVRLMDRMEALERHFASTPMIGKQEIDLEAVKEKEKEENKKWWGEFWIGLSVCVFMVWWMGVLGVTIVLPAWGKRHGGGEGSN